MLKITNDGLTRSVGLAQDAFVIAVPVRQQRASKGKRMFKADNLVVASVSSKQRSRSFILVPNYRSFSY